MRVINARNVNDAYAKGMSLLRHEGARADSRGGPVLVAAWPVTTVYRNPCERVLFDAQRDANPFFHLMEGLWMLAGRGDARFLETYIKRFGEHAEPNGLIHGAYGYRWRKAFGFDQLEIIVRKLRENPDDRQAVLQMWDCMPTVDTDWGWIGQSDLQSLWHDRPCNTHVYFRVRQLIDSEKKNRSVLDMTVCCRSNDIIWGAYGANAVHMSMLQEYMAAAIGVGVGTYYQVSNNYHAYQDVYDKCSDPDKTIHFHDPYSTDRDVRPWPLVHVPSSFLHETEIMLTTVETLGEDLPDKIIYEQVRKLENEFLWRTAWPMMMAHMFWKLRVEAVTRNWLNQIQASDWRLAATRWIERRAK